MPWPTESVAAALKEETQLEAKQRTFNDWRAWGEEVEEDNGCFKTERQTEDHQWTAWKTEDQDGWSEWAEWGVGLKEEAEEAEEGAAWTTAVKAESHSWTNGQWASWASVKAESRSWTPRSKDTKYKNAVIPSEYYERWLLQDSYNAIIIITLQ